MAGNQPADLDKIKVSDIRGLSRGEIENLVAEGLLPQDIADEVLTEEDHQQQAQAQDDDHERQVQAQERKEVRAEESAWLEAMSESYKQEYHRLMDTYDRNEGDYRNIKSDAEKLKNRLQDKINTFYQFGVRLPDGRMAFYDRQQNAFVDASLQPLNDADTKQAANEFKKLSPKEQRENACYASACHAYANADEISQTADTGVAQTEEGKKELAQSNGSLSEERLKNLGQTSQLKVDDLSKKLKGVEHDEDDLNAALSENSAPASRSESGSKEPDSKSAQSGISFASTIDGGSNGKTASTFNAVANGAPVRDAPDYTSRPLAAPSTLAP